MDSHFGVGMFGTLVGVAVLVLFGPPILLALYRWIGHRRGRWFRRSVHRRRH